MTEEKYVPKILEVLIWPDERLHDESYDVEQNLFDEDLEHLVADMFTTMHARGGVGLAAPQVGYNFRIIVIELEPERPLVLINPKIHVGSKKMFKWEEGCLSVPGYFEYRERPDMIVVKYNTIKGERVSTEFHGLYAFAIQHEYDHLEGKVFVDKSSWLKKGRIKKKMAKSLPGILSQMNSVKDKAIEEGMREVNLLKNIDNYEAVENT